MIYTKRCPVCLKLYKTKMVKQIVCGEVCRAVRLQAQHNRRSIPEFKEQKIKDYLSKIERHDKKMAEWMKNNPIQQLSGGDINVFAKDYRDRYGHD